MIYVRTNTRTHKSTHANTCSLVRITRYANFEILFSNIGFHQCWGPSLLFRVILKTWNSNLKTISNFHMVAKWGLYFCNGYLWDLQDLNSTSHEKIRQGFFSFDRITWAMLRKWQDKIIEWKVRATHLPLQPHLIHYILRSKKERKILF